MNTNPWVVLVNPQAGSKAVSEQEVIDALAQHGVRGDIEVINTVDEMRTAACDVVRSKRPVCVVGGDGTISATVDALVAARLGSETILGVLPAGTGCDLIRTFGLPQSISEAARHLGTDTTYPIDVGRAEGEWGVRYFTNAITTGLGAAVVAASAKMSRRLGVARYGAGVVIAAPGFVRTEVELVTEQRTHRQDALMMVAANGQFFAGGWNVAPRALLVDGELDTQLYNVPKRAIPKLIPRLVKGMHLDHPGVRRRSISEFRFSSADPWPVEVDGDVIGVGSFAVSVIRSGVTLKI